MNELVGYALIGYGIGGLTIGSLTFLWCYQQTQQWKTMAHTWQGLYYTLKDRTEGADVEGEERD